MPELVSSHGGMTDSPPSTERLGRERTFCRNSSAMSRGRSVAPLRTSSYFFALPPPPQPANATASATALITGNRGANQVIGQPSVWNRRRKVTRDAAHHH